jgi:Flp pilus assembly protein TadG
MNRKHSSERGNSILEFALVASLFLVPMLIGSYTLGMTLVKSQQVQQVCRDANILVVRGIDMSQSDNQSLVVKTAAGLGMNTAGTNNPSSTGLGVLILSTVYRVSDNDCIALGKPANSSCTNWHYYVFTRRIVIGNSAKMPNGSVTGAPTDTLASDGTLTPTQYVLDSGDRANGFPPITALLPTDAGATSGLVFLPAYANAYICEAGFDVSAINVFQVPGLGIIYARHIS